MVVRSEKSLWEEKVWPGFDVLVRQSRGNHIEPDGLPPGIRQADCDRKYDPLAHHTDIQLWRICTDDQRTSIADAFLTARTDELRDAVLESQDAGGSRELGRLIWKTWVLYRERALNDLHRRGVLRSI
jgi:hypothetical protein